MRRKFAELNLNIMEANNLTITTLQNLFDYDLRKFTGAEVQLKRHLPEWINRSNSLKLKTILQKYLDFVTTHLVY